MGDLTFILAFAFMTFKFFQFFQFYQFLFIYLAIKEEVFLDFKYSFTYPIFFISI